MSEQDELYICDLEPTYYRYYSRYTEEFNIKYYQLLPIVKDIILTILNSSNNFIYSGYSWNSDNHEFSKEFGIPIYVNIFNQLQYDEDYKDNSNIIIYTSNVWEDCKQEGIMAHDLFLIEYAKTLIPDNIDRYDLSFIKDKTNMKLVLNILYMIDDLLQAKIFLEIYNLGFNNHDISSAFDERVEIISNVRTFLISWWMFHILFTKNFPFIIKIILYMGLLFQKHFEYENSILTKEYVDSYIDDSEKVNIMSILNFILHHLIVYENKVIETVSKALHDRIYKGE